MCCGQRTRFLSLYLGHTAKNVQVAKSPLTSFNIRDQQADTRMRSHCSVQLVDDKPVVSCQQDCCTLIVKTCYPTSCLNKL